MLGQNEGEVSRLMIGPAARVVRLIGACDGDGRFVSVGKERWPSNTCTGVWARFVDLLSGRK